MYEKFKCIKEIVTTNFDWIDFFKTIKVMVLFTYLPNTNSPVKLNFDLEQIFFDGMWLYTGIYIA